MRACMQGIPGVPEIRPGLNPATWVLEITTPAAEQRMGADFADLYAQSELYRCNWAGPPLERAMWHPNPGGDCFSLRHMRRRNEEMIAAESRPRPGAQPLRFDSQYAQPLWVHYAVCLWRNNLIWWRSPQVRCGLRHP